MAKWAYWSYFSKVISTIVPTLPPIFAICPTALIDNLTQIKLTDILPCLNPKLISIGTQLAVVLFFRAKTSKKRLKNA